MFYWLAQLSQDVPNTFASDLLLNLIPNLGVLSILVWFLHHTVKYTIPELNAQNNKTIQAMVAEHKAAIAELTAAHRQTVRELTDKFDEQVKEERTMRQAEIKDLAQAIRELKR